jgi:hypothetical protein
MCPNCDHERDEHQPGEGCIHDEPHYSPARRVVVGVGRCACPFIDWVL